MKQLVYFLMIVLSAIVCQGTATAQRTLNLDTISNEISPVDVSRTIEPTNDGYIVTYTINRLALDPDDDLLDCETPVIRGSSNNNVYNVGISKGIAKKDIKLLREDWVWKYHQYFNIDYSDPNNTSGKDACSDIYLNIGFSGTTVIGGVEYQNCTIWKDGEEPANGEAPVIAYMREEGNRIYMREATPSGGLYQTLFNDYNISIKPYICPALEWVPDSNTEMLIYDFDLDKGEILWFDSECRDDDAGLPVTLRYTGTVDNKEVDIQWFETRLDEEAAVYCGFGSADSLLPFPGTYNEFQWEPHGLICITDRENNPVITMPTGGFPPLPDETGITSVKQTADVSYFDMQGRQVPKPDNGIFIRIERKSDGSVVTRKVCLRK